MKKIAYIDHLCNNKEYIYYSSFFNALKTQDTEIREFNNCPEDLSGFDIVIFGLGFFASESPSHYLKPRPFLANAPCKKIAIIHKIKNHYGAKLSFCRYNKIDLILTTTPFSRKFDWDSEIPCGTLPYCADKNVFKNLGIEKKYDIGFSGALHAGKKNGCEDELENIRVKIRDELSKTDLNVFWNGTDRVETRIKSTEEYVKKINECKLWLCVTGPSYDVNPRYHETALCGTGVFTNEIPQGDYDHIFEDMKNCVRFKNDLSDFNFKLREALSRYNSYQKNEHIHAQKNSSYEGRGKQLMEYINGL